MSKNININLDKPKAGWVSVTVGNFDFRASYLTDVPMDILKSSLCALKDNGEFNICLDSEINEKQSALIPITQDGIIYSGQKYVQNQDIGYMYEDFVYDDELTFTADSKVTDILDKIKN